MRVSLVLLVFFAFACVHAQTVEEHYRQKDLKVCQACTLACGILQRELEALAYPTATETITANMQEPINLLRKVPDMGGNRDKLILQSLQRITQPFSYDRWEEIMTGAHTDLCYRIALCNIVPQTKDSCGDCLEGCCTSWNECVCGNGINKRKRVRFDDPVLPYLTEDQYTRIITKEDIENQARKAEIMQEKINAAGGVDQYVEKLEQQIDAKTNSDKPAESAEFDQETMIM